MDRKVYLDFQDGDGFIDVSSYVKCDSLNITLRAFSDNFHYAQNEAHFDIIYDATLYSQILSATEDILVRILDVYDDAYIVSEYGEYILTESDFYIVRETGEGDPIFYGRIVPNKSRIYNGILNNTILNIEALDDTRELDVKVGDICWRNYTVMNPADTSTSIVHQLAYLAGLTDSQIDQTITISNVLGAFVPNSPDDLITDILDTLLFEHKYALNFNVSGQLSPILWGNDSGTVDYAYTDTNIIKQIEIEDSIKDYDGAEVIWYELKEAVTASGSTEILLYRDTALPYSDTEGFAGYPVISGYYYPIETNVVDDITGSGQIVYQEYDDASMRYWTNEAIVNNLDYNYKVFKSDYSDMVATSGWRLDWAGDSGVSLVVSNFWNRKAQIRFYSNSNIDNKLYYCNIYGGVLYKGIERKSTKYNITNARTIDRYVSMFLFNQTDADSLALYLAAIYDSGNFNFSFELDVVSTETPNVGALVNIVLGEGTNLTCILVEKTFDEATQLYKFKARSFSNTIGTLTSRTLGISPSQPTVDLVSSTLSNYSVSVDASVFGANPDLTNAYTTMKVYRHTFDDSMFWTYSATASGVTGSFGTGATKNTYTISAFDSDDTVQGLVTITASRTGFTDQIKEFRINKIYQGGLEHGYLYVVPSTYSGLAFYDYKCDGTDDQVEIQAAITALNSIGGGEIKAAKGDFNLSNYINLCSNLVFGGSGSNTRLRLNTAAHNTILAASGLKNTVIKDMVLDGCAETIVHTDSFLGLSFSSPEDVSEISCYNVVVQNAKVVGNAAGYVGVVGFQFVDNLYNCSVRDMYSENQIGTSSGTALVYGFSRATNVNGCSFYNITCSGYYTTIVGATLCENVNDLVIDNCFSYGGPLCYVYGALYTNSINNISVKTVEFYGSNGNAWGCAYSNVLSGCGVDYPATISGTKYLSGYLTCKTLVNCHVTNVAPYVGAAGFNNCFSMEHCSVSGYGALYSYQGSYASAVASGTYACADTPNGGFNSYV